MHEFDQKLLKEFRDQFDATGSAKFKDPKYPYEVSVEPTKHAHMITVIDTRKRWFGRVIMKNEHPINRRSDIADYGPVSAAIVCLEMAIEKAFPLW